MKLGPEATRAQSHLYDTASGASPLTISCFHAVDALTTTVAELDVPGRDLPVAEAPVGNVYRLYAQLAADLRDGTHHTPSFERALHQHRVIAAIEHASATLDRAP
ncbi:MAG TPA: hypothetical protein VGC42_28815 [Kofleriaceae bacterium]